MIEDPYFYTNTDEKCAKLVAELASNTMTNVLLRLFATSLWCFLIPASFYMIMKIFNINGIITIIISVGNVFFVILSMIHWLMIANYRSRFIQRVFNIEYSAAIIAEIQNLAIDFDNEFETTFAVYWVRKYV